MTDFDHMESDSGLDDATALVEASPAPCRVPASLVSHREADDSYPGIVMISDKVRVVNCKDDMQWIVQRRSGDQWRAMSFCRTRKVLIRDARRRNDDELSPSALAILEALPDRHA